jgi:hypothetical protein
LTSGTSALKQGGVGSLQIVVQSAELGGSDVSAQAHRSSCLASELSAHEICGWPWRSAGKDDIDSKYGQVPRRLNQTAYFIHLELPFILCLPIKTGVTWDYSLIPNKRTEFIFFLLIARTTVQREIVEADQVADHG